jgi:hypothetical protein
MTTIPHFAPPGSQALPVVLLEAQRRNLIAWAQAGKVAFEGFGLLMQRQADLVNAAAEDWRRDVLDGRSPGHSPHHAAQDIATRLHELFEIAAETQRASIDILHTRWSEALVEAGTLFAGAGSATRTADDVP